MPRHPRLIPILTAALLGASPMTARAQEDGSGDLMQPDTVQQLDQVRDQMQAAEKPRPAAPGAVPSIDLGKPSAPVEPQRTDVEAAPSRVGLPAARIDLDPSVIGVAPGQAPPVLLREGQFIVNRRGRLQRVEGSGVLLLVFEPREGQAAPDTPMVVQACTTLELIEELVERRGTDTPLVVSGQVHAYRGFNYLLPTMMEPAAALSPPEPEAQPAPPADAVVPAEAPLQEEADPDAEGEAAEGEPVAAEPAEDDVMAQLLRMRQDDAPAAAPAAEESFDPARPLIEAIGELVPTAVKVKIDREVIGIAPEMAMPPLKREGEFLVARRGRLVRSPEGKGLLFVFEADNARSPELPMVVQPSRLRQSMEDIVEDRGDGVVFIVSGQVHTYRGANYLLPTMMKLAVDKGNLLN